MKHPKGKASANPASASSTPIRMGEALAAIGRKFGLTEEEAAIIDAVRDKTPAEPLPLWESKMRKTRP